MRIAYRGNFGPTHSTENHVALAFEELGHEVTQLQEDRQGWAEVRAYARTSDLFLWTRTWRLDDDGARHTLDWLRDRGVPSASFHLDRYFGLARADTLGDDPFWRTDHVFSADGDHDANFAALGINHHWLRPGVAASEGQPGTYREDLAADVGFVGSEGYHPEWSYRPELIAWLRSTYGDRFRLFTGGVRGRELADVYASVKVVVGDSCCPGFDCRRYWSDRVYETLGRQGFLIHPAIEGLADEFTDDRHLALYPFGDFGALRSAIDGYLVASGSRARIAQAGRARVLDRCTYAHRMATLLDVIGGDERAAGRKVPTIRAGYQLRNAQCATRVGLWGARADNRGLGIQTQEFARHMEPDRTVVVDMEAKSPLPARPDRFPGATTLPLGGLTEPVMREFLGDVDVVFMAETPYNDRLLALAAERGVGTVVQTNWEFCRWATDAALPRPDLFAAPSSWHYPELPEPKALLPFPVARDRLPFRLRTRAHTFLHVAGVGTQADRNGTRALLGALAYVTAEVTVVVRTQMPLPITDAVPPNVDLRVERVDVEDYWQLYEGADVLVLPRRFGGLSLPINEAQSLGMPVITTDLEPQRRFLPPECLVRCPTSRASRSASGTLVVHDPDPRDVSRAIDRLANDPALVERLSYEADAYAESISWEVLGPQYRDLLRDVSRAARPRPPVPPPPPAPVVAHGPVDAYATEPHYADHLLPIWRALPPDERGRFHAPPHVRERLARQGMHGYELRPGQPPASPGACLVASWVDLAAVRGNRPAIFVEHGAGQSYGDGNPAYSGGTNRDGAVLFLCPNEDVAARNRAAYPDIASVAVGCPKLDGYGGASGGASEEDWRTNPMGWSADPVGAPAKPAMGVAVPNGAIRPTAPLEAGPGAVTGLSGQSAHRGVTVGAADVDCLPATEGTHERAITGGHPDAHPVVAFSFHWEFDQVPEGRTAFPHYREAIAALARRLAAMDGKDWPFTLLGHGHPRALDHLRPFYASVGIEVAADFDEVLARADLYVCDTSSTIYEFAAAGGPVLLLNAPWYRRDVEHGLRFWAQADVGLQVDEPAELEAAITAALTDPPAVRQKRLTAVRAVYGDLDGHASRRAVDAIHALSLAPVALVSTGDPYAPQGPPVYANEVAPRVTVYASPLDRLVALGAPPEMMAGVQQEWQALTAVDQAAWAATVAGLSDDEVRARIANYHEAKPAAPGFAVPPEVPVPPSAREGAGQRGPRAAGLAQKRPRRPKAPADG